MCCITTGGLYTYKRMINLKKSVELSGGIILSPPKSYYCQIAIRFLLLIASCALIGIAYATFETTEELQDTYLIDDDGDEYYDNRVMFTKTFAFTTWFLYAIYLLITIIIAVLSYCKSNGCDSPVCINMLYYITLPIYQCIPSVVFQTFITLPLGQFITLIIIIEFFLNTIQFNYIIGTLSVTIYNLLFIIIYEFGIKDSFKPNEKQISYPLWIILCILWQILFTHFKNYANMKWFTSPRVLLKVNEEQLLEKYSTERGENELRLLAINNPTENGNKFVTIAMGSCVDQRKNTMPVYLALHRELPDVVLLLGDNVYADLAPPTITKLITTCCKTKRVFKEEYDRLLNHKDFKPNGYDYSKQLWLATWDDHDYGENDAAKEYAEKLPSKEAFIQFVEQINDKPEIKEQMDAIKDDNARGIYHVYDYEQKLDAENVKLRIIMMDTRFDRAEDETDIVGEEQWEWLKQQMDGPDDIDWYLVCNGSPLLNEGQWVGDGDERHKKKTVGQETRDKLFEILRRNDGKLLNKTVLLSGDLHYSVWHSYQDQLYELTASSMTHGKPWFCGKNKLKYLEINDYTCSKENNGNGATNKSEPCQKNSFGILKINKNKFNFCVKDAFGYSYLNVSHEKK